MMFSTNGDVQKESQNRRFPRRRFLSQGSVFGTLEAGLDEESGGVRKPSNSDESVRSDKKYRDSASAAHNTTKLFKMMHATK